MTEPTTPRTRSARLSQILGLRAGAQQRSHEALTALYHRVEQPGRYLGQRREYVPDAVSEEQAQGQSDQSKQKPPEHKKVEQNAADMLEQMAGTVTRFYDLQLTMDEADTRARADVVITTSDGTERTLLRDVPVTTLMFLEKRLKTDIETFIRKLPTLDPSRDWHESGTPGVYQTEPTETISTTKTKRWAETSPATKEHKAQVIVWDDDVRAGVWRSTLLSGALPPERLGQVLERLYQLRDAVSAARERANQVEVEDRRMGDALMDFILRG